MADATEEPFLQPVDGARLTYVRSGFAVTATSQGRSMLLLPVQYSHCLGVRVRGGDAHPRVVRANLAQVGILFDRRLDVVARWRFGYFGDGSCRSGRPEGRG